MTPSVTLAAADLPAAEPEYWLDREINPRLSYNSVVDPNFNPAGGPDPLLVDQEFAPRVYLPLLYRFVAPTTGTVAGVVANASTSQPLSGAEVCVVSSSQCATTNAQGAYGISSVAVGSQTVRATATDFEASQQSATVPAGGTVTVDFALTPIPLSEWTNIATEDFEGSFPQAGWHVEDSEPGYGKYYWAKRTCRPKSGSYSGWAVGGGADGSGLACGDDYPNNAFSRLIYGPFSLVGATDAEMLYDYWVQSEPDFDELFVGASINGADFYGSSVSGDSGGWSSGNLDLTDVSSLGNLLGQPNVWIAFDFTSDSSIALPEGAYVDTIVLRKRTGSMAGQPTRRLSCDVVRQADYVLDPCASVTAAR